MYRVLALILTTIITSYYYFPVSFMVLPTVNTKLVLAVLGLIWFVFESVKDNHIDIKDDYMSLFMTSLVFSLVCFSSVVLNNTADYAYATYFISMSVWLFGAYFVCNLIKNVHGKISVEIVAHYLIVVCVAQCILAIVIDNSPSFKSLVDSVFSQDQEFLTEVDRLYGIGAMLDTAGIRFSLVLVLISYMIVRSSDTVLERYKYLYIVSFFVVSIIGCIMARTTTVGVLIGLAYLLYKQIFSNMSIRPFNLRDIIIGNISLVFLGTIIIYLYNTNEQVYHYLRFGFEGFFSLFEQGEWEVGSNTQLKNMIVFPETLKTWFIGDGYFNNPVATDPYFVGKVTGGYYMGTDVGYLRFIFYCGLIGLLAFSLFLYRACALCCNKFPQRKLLFYLLLVVNFICWLKVSTDTFLIFALMIMVDKDCNQTYGEEISVLEA